MYVRNWYGQLIRRPELTPSEEAAHTARWAAMRAREQERFDRELVDRELLPLREQIRANRSLLSRVRWARHRLDNMILDVAYTHQLLDEEWILAAGAARIVPGGAQ